jgi:hypothetical protein
MGEVWKLDEAAAEVIAAYREHVAMLLVGGHEPKRITVAVDALEVALKERRCPQAA